MLDYSKSFIEVQFPVSKVSKESYKERVSGASQTLTGFGKWWGRKPLILVRATLLAALMPVSDNPIKDKEIFLKILTMDDEGLWLRKNQNIPIKEIYMNLNQIERKRYFSPESTENRPVLNPAVSKEEKVYLQKLVFNRFSYDAKLKYCIRPEYFESHELIDWTSINEHLETSAASIHELIDELGRKRFGRKPRIGDVFTGGGSIPFEAARMGADVYASDLNPMAALLTWASIYIGGASDSEKKKIFAAREKVLSEILGTVDEWGIEKNELGYIANSYMYCNEAICPECGYKVTLSGSWSLSKSINAVAVLAENNEKSFDIGVVQNATKEQIELSKAQTTISDNNMVCLHCGMKTPISSLRGDKKDSNGETVYGLRQWNKEEYIPRSNDVYTERLYAIRYINGSQRVYQAPTPADIKREDRVLELLDERFDAWQKKGFIPSDVIEEGYNTNQPIREKGWRYWHQLFNPRQLLSLGLMNEIISKIEEPIVRVSLGLSLSKFADWNSKLSIWNSGAGAEKVQNTFLNQALNTLYNYGTRAVNTLSVGSIWHYSLPENQFNESSIVEVKDARTTSELCDIFITDPPYADAVNYHELTEFFLPWNKNLLKEIFPEWYTDSKRVLAVKGTGSDFNHSMIDVYKNLAQNMPDNGYQVVMFTHQDVKVWSELSMILWSAGLRVVSAWNIATETESGGLKAGGNYVKGTVLLTLKKQTSDEVAFQDELYDEIKYEVKHIIDSMKSLDDKDDPDFTDADYLLASYAASLKVLTAYKEIDGIDVEYWLAQPRDSKEENPIEALINKAVRIAYDYLIPEGFDNSLWKDLRPEERFFIRGLEVEMSGVSKISSYQELARGFGVNDYTDMFANFRANTARLKTPSEYRMAFLNGDGFGSTLLRHLLVAINETTENKSTVEGRAYLKNVFQQDNAYWYKKPLMIELLSFIANLEFVDHMKHWHEHAYSAKILKEALKNEGV